MKRLLFPLFILFPLVVNASADFTCDTTITPYDSDERAYAFNRFEETSIKAYLKDVIYTAPTNSPNGCSVKVVKGRNLQGQLTIELIEQKGFGSRHEDCGKSGKNDQFTCDENQGCAAWDRVDENQYYRWHLCADPDGTMVMRVGRMHPITYRYRPLP